MLLTDIPAWIDVIDARNDGLVSAEEVDMLIKICRSLYAKNVEAETLLAEVAVILNNLPPGAEAVIDVLHASGALE